MAKLGQLARLLRVPLRAAAGLGGMAGWLARRLGRGGGTTLPGKVALVLRPEALAELSGRLDAGCVTVSGTNGKTTTARLLANCAAAGGLEVCANSAGANLTSGVASALLPLAKAAGTGSPASAALGIFEVDEAALPEVAAAAAPKLIVLLNLFRDQLDRHGELEAIALKWADMISQLAPSTRLLVNADDPGLVAIAQQRPDLEVLYFGVLDSAVDRHSAPHAADTIRCRHCRSQLNYRFHTIGHQGDWFCPDCDWRRPPLDFAAAEISIGSSQSVMFGDSRAELKLNSELPGLHNIYNCLAAAAAASWLSVPADVVAAAVAGTEPVFGRAEEVALGRQRLLIFLAKNPTGANENIHTIAGIGRPFTLLLALNDRVADGHDTSWIWDVDYEPLFAQADKIVFTGDRAHEAALRYRYRTGSDSNSESDMDSESESDSDSNSNVGGAAETPVIPEISQALQHARELTPDDGLIIALPTYTATLELRQVLADAGAVKPFWEQR